MTHKELRAAMRLTLFAEFNAVDPNRVVPNHDGSDHQLRVALDKLDRMNDRRANFPEEGADVGSMTRPEGELFPYSVNVAAGMNPDGTIKVKTMEVKAASIEDAMRIATQMNAGRETGYGAGVLLFSRKTGRFLFVKRGPNGDEPGTWCTGGGGVEPDETIEQAVRRENQEELGFDGEYELIHMDRQASPGFVFHNHMAVIDDEFEPVLNDEHTEYRWCEPDQIPEPLHPGLRLALSNWMKRQGVSE